MVGGAPDRRNPGPRSVAAIPAGFATLPRAMWTAEDHTADALLVVEAASWSELLAESAKAFGSWMSSGETPAPPDAMVEREVRVDGVDATETWVRFWRALLRLWTVEAVLAVEAEVEADGDKARARVRCVPAAALDDALLTDVKAVTWHDAEAGARADGSWRGRIVLDI